MARTGVRVPSTSYFLGSNPHQTRAVTYSKVLFCFHLKRKDFLSLPCVICEEGIAVQPCPEVGMGVKRGHNRKLTQAVAEGHCIGSRHTFLFSLEMVPATRVGLASLSPRLEGRGVSTQRGHTVRE